MFVDENEGLRVAHQVDVAQFPEDAVLLFREVAEPVVARVHGLAHREAAHPGMTLPLDGDVAAVRWAFVNTRRLGVGRQLGVTRIQQPGHVRVVGIACAVIQHATHPPGPVSGEIVPNKVVVVVVGIQQPGQRQLLLVVHAGNPLRLGLRLPQGGKEHSGQDRDDRNHHQKFYQGEGPRRTALSAGEQWGRSHVVRPGSIRFHRIVNVDLYNINKSAPESQWNYWRPR